MFRSKVYPIGGTSVQRFFYNRVSFYVSRHQNSISFTYFVRRSASSDISLQFISNIAKRSLDSCIVQDSGVKVVSYIVSPQKLGCYCYLHVFYKRFYNGERQI